MTDKRSKPRLALFLAALWLLSGGTGLAAQCAGHAPAWHHGVAAPGHSDHDQRRDEHGHSAPADCCGVIEVRIDACAQPVLAAARGAVVPAGPFTDDESPPALPGPADPTPLSPARSTRIAELPAGVDLLPSLFARLRVLRL